MKDEKLPTKKMKNEIILVNKIIKDKNANKMENGHIKI